ncbi:hypothetical protein HAX54_038362 [Datura stramonium]|uniref:Uncharacterized protein n=1 Tax=Datura stramonium TaxID=4076 RepID=A0ABS8VLC2_DATST|nr:hypothetical protein [Datura stramonium]
MGCVRVHMLGYMKQASRLASTNYDEGDPFGAAGMSLSQRLVNRHAADVGITRCGLLAIDEARLCLCVWQLAAGTGLSQRLVNRHAAAVGITQCGLFAIDEVRLCLCVPATRCRHWS